MLIKKPKKLYESNHMMVLPVLFCVKHDSGIRDEDKQCVINVIDDVDASFQP